MYRNRPLPFVANRRKGFRLNLEMLERRDVPSASPFVGPLPSLFEQEGNDIASHAMELGTVRVSSPGDVSGTIGNGGHGAADVDWFKFELDQAGTVTINSISADPKVFSSVLSLYQSPSPSSVASIFTSLSGYESLYQDDGALHGGNPRFTLNLPAGAYWVAVSGSGNRYFNPLLENSGTFGSVGDYDLKITTAPVPSSAQLRILHANPAPGAVLGTSPLVLKIGLNRADLDPATMNIQETTGSDGSLQAPTVVLLYNRNTPPTLANGIQINLQALSFDALTQELQIQPSAALARGYYRIVLRGDAAKNGAVITDTLGQPLGNDLTLSFQVKGAEQSSGFTDLGNLSNSGSAQQAGVIGDDPSAKRAGVDTDSYHFQLNGLGTWNLTAEVFAGRIDSWLDSNLQLYRIESDGSRLLLRTNNNTKNQSLTPDGSFVPLQLDSLINVALTFGQYELIVSTGSPLPFDENEPLLLPATGAYVLNVQAQPIVGNVPHVLATNLTANSNLSAPPVQIAVQFDKPMDTVSLAYLTLNASSADALNAIYIVNSSGSIYFPRYVSYDGVTNTATFSMLDALPDGGYDLHLSGAGGIVDLGGNPLGEESIVHFNVVNSQRGTPGHPTIWTGGKGDDSLATPQIIGPLFRNELTGSARVTINRAVRNQASAPLDSADYYQITMTERGAYSFALSPSNANLLRTAVQVFDAQGNLGTLTFSAISGQYTGFFEPGTYIIKIGGAGWSPALSGQIAYSLKISLKLAAENPTPLTIGPSPAVQFRLVTTSPAPPIAAPPVAVVIQQPPTNEGGVVSVSFSVASTVPPTTAAAPTSISSGLSATPLGGVSTPVTLPPTFHRLEVPEPGVYFTTAEETGATQEETKATFSVVPQDWTQDGDAAFRTLGHPLVTLVSVNPVPLATVAMVVDNAIAALAWSTAVRTEQGIVPLALDTTAQPSIAPHSAAPEVATGSILLRIFPWARLTLSLAAGALFMGFSRPAMTERLRRKYPR